MRGFKARHGRNCSAKHTRREPLPNDTTMNQRNRCIIFDTASAEVDSKNEKKIENLIESFITRNNISRVSNK